MSSMKCAGLTTDRLWSLIAGVVPGTAVLLSRMAVNDLAYQVRAGELMVSSGHVLRSDPFTFTIPGRAWVDQQWGAQILLRALYLPAGWSGLVLVRATLIAVSFWIVYNWTLRGSRDRLTAACLTLGGLLISIALPGTLALRPQLLAVPLFLVTVWILRERAKHPARLAWLPIVTIVWTNLHGSFVLASLLVGIAFVADVLAQSETARWSGPIAVLCAIFPVLNPWGFSVYSYVAHVSTDPIVRDVIDEWQPIWRQELAGPLFLIALAAISALLWHRRRRMPNAEELLGFAAFTILAAFSGRNLLWWSLYVPPLVGGLLRKRQAGTSERTPLAPVLVIALVSLLGFGVARVALAHPSASLLSEAPLGVTTALDRAVAGSDHRVFDGWWGSWFEFAEPGLPMFVDARAELFPDPVWLDFFTISSASRGWESVLRRWRIDVVVASWGHQAPLIATLDRDPSWRSVYRDVDGVVFVRS